MVNTATKAIAIVVLIALAVIAQIIVGVLGQVSYSVNQSLAGAVSTYAYAQGVSANAMAFNSLVTPANIVFTCTGSCSWISTLYPLTVTVTGYTVTTPSSNTVLAVPSASTTSLTYTVTASTQTLNSASNFYNITSVTLSQAPQEYASMNGIITETYNAITLGSHPIAATTNTIVGSNKVTVTQNGQALTWYNTGGTNVTTILSFMSVVFLVAAVIILLDLFGLSKILKVGNQVGGRNE